MAGSGEAHWRSSRIGPLVWVLGSVGLAFGVGMASLSVGDKGLDGFYGHENTVTASGRCEALEFTVGKPPVDLSTVSRTIQGVFLIPPPEGGECKAFEQRARVWVPLAQAGVLVTCPGEWSAASGEDLKGSKNL